VPGAGRAARSTTDQDRLVAARQAAAVLPARRDEAEEVLRDHLA